MKKRGYFFTIDVSIALIILVVGFLLIWSFYITSARKEQPYFYSQDAIDIMSGTRIGAITGTIPQVRQLIRDGNITDIDNTILEQAALSYIYDNDKRESNVQNPCGPDPTICKTYAPQNLTRFVLEDVIPEQYGLHVLLNGTSLFVENSTTGIWENESNVLISSKRMVVVVLNKVNLSEPLMMEVRVWR